MAACGRAATVLGCCASDQRVPAIQEARMRSFLAGAAAVVLLTGCGTALARPGTGHSGGRPRTAVVVTGSRAQAQAYVRHLLAELSLPSGSVPAHVRSLPRIARARAPGAPGWAGASRIL